jgi:hypothetical protein
VGRGSRTSLDIKREIERLAITDPDTTARAVMEAMDRDEKYAGRVPEIRTIQHIMRAVRVVRTPRDAWSLASNTYRDIDPGLVLKTLGAVHTVTAGRVAFFSHDEAEMITKIRRAHARMPSVPAYVLAQRYLARREAGDPSTLDLDLELAVQAWNGEDDVLDVVDVSDARLEDA